MARQSSLTDLVTQVVFAIQTVDEHVLNSDYISYEVIQLEPGDKPLPYDYSNPEVYLERFDGLGYWEQYFEWVLKEWDLDEDGERMSEAKFNFIIDRLTAAATILDLYGPQLVRRYREIGNVPEKRIHGVLRRRAILNGFLNSAALALENWYRGMGILKDRRLRSRRRLPDPGGPEEEVEENMALAAAETIRNGPRVDEREKQRGWISRSFRGGNAILLNNSAVLSLVVFVIIISAIIQMYGFTVAITSAEKKQAAVTDPDFYSGLQSCLMQGLGLYITMLPALRHHQLQHSYTWWIWLSALLAFLAIITAAVSYVFSPAVSQLALFLASAIQSLMVLQLIWAVETVTKMNSKAEENA
ncbi:putative RGS domain-containing protein [Seiridium cardinale]|uniref:RGS domain-containing protein n=1 Tax=Seiridium cardinale TaxID=138064 RepID=A0ABR2XFI7_9PEZI